MATAHPSRSRHRTSAVAKRPTTEPPNHLEIGEGLAEWRTRSPSEGVISPYYPAHPEVPYKERNALALRKLEAARIRKANPEKLPIIIERNPKEKKLPVLPQVKYVVPKNWVFSQLHIVVRRKLQLEAQMTVCLRIPKVGRVFMHPTYSSTIAEVHEKYADRDGFLYVVYSSQDFWG